MKSKNIVLQPRRYKGSVTPPLSLEDTSPFGNNGAFGAGIAAPTWTRLPSGLWVLSFDGANTQIQVTNAPSLNFISKCSIEFWAKFNSFPAPGGLEYVFDKGLLGASTGWMVLVDGVNPYVSLLIGNGVAAPAAHSSVLTTGVWNHFIGTFEGRYEKMYQNGVLIHTMDFGVYITIVNVVDNLFIGCESAPGEYADMFFSPTCIYNCDLTPAQVYSRFQKDRSWFGV